MITVGTGAFISVNCGDKPLSSKNANYPLVGFKYLNDKMFIIHNAIPTAGIAIDWAKSIDKKKFFEFIFKNKIFILNRNI